MNSLKYYPTSAQSSASRRLDAAPSSVGADLPIVLAVDGGGSKTDLVALTMAGDVLLTTRGPSSNPQTQGLGTAVAVVDRLITDALEATRAPAVVQTSLYLSGLDLPEEVEAFRAALGEFTWAAGTSSAITIDNDLFALLRTGTTALDAVAVICGTGLNAIGVRSDGEVARFPALGMISGDWGGGAFLGEQALWHASRSEDLRGPRTRLERLVADAFGCDDVRSVAAALHLGKLPQSSIARLAPVLFEAAAHSDPVALSVVDRQADEIALMIQSILERLELVGCAVPVLLGGGVLTAQDRLLYTRVVGCLAARIPHAVPEMVTNPPVLGAALLALQTAGSDDESLRRAEFALTGIGGTNPE